MAENIHCPPELLDQFVPELADSVARNPNCSLGLLVNLAQHNHFVVRSAVARNRNCPQHLLEQLGGDRHWVVRQAVAQHRQCPLPLLVKLATDQDVRVRHVAVRYLQHRYCSQALLGQLVKNSDPVVRRAVAEPTEANQGRLNVVPERRRNPCPLGQGGCQSFHLAFTSARSPASASPIVKLLKARNWQTRSHHTTFVHSCCRAF